MWEEIIGNCDTQLFLGCTDDQTSEIISKRSGEMTIEVDSERLSRQTMTLTQSIPDYTETTSVGKRYLLTPDEVKRLENTKCLIILRGQKVYKANKYDYSNHPESQKFIESPIRDYVPLWRARTEGKNTVSKVEEDDEELEKMATGEKDNTETEEVPFDPKKAKSQPVEKESASSKVEDPLMGMANDDIFSDENTIDKSEFSSKSSKKNEAQNPQVDKPHFGTSYTSEKDYQEDYGKKHQEEKERREREKEEKKNKNIEKYGHDTHSEKEYKEYKRSHQTMEIKDVSDSEIFDILQANDRGNKIKSVI